MTIIAKKVEKSMRMALEVNICKTLCSSGLVGLFILVEKDA